MPTETWKRYSKVFAGAEKKIGTYLAVVLPFASTRSHDNQRIFIQKIAARSSEYPSER